MTKYDRIIGRFHGRISVDNGKPTVTPASTNATLVTEEDETLQVFTSASCEAGKQWYVNAPIRDPADPAFDKSAVLLIAEASRNDNRQVCSSS